MTKDLDTLSKKAKQLELSPESRGELMQQVQAYAGAYLDEQASLPMYQHTPNRAAGLLNHQIQENGASMEHLLSLLETYVDKDGLNATGGKHMAYIPAGGLFTGAIGDFLGAVTNRYAGVFFANPGAVRMENMLIRWMRDLVGFPETTAGHLASGGSIASLSAIVSARDAKGLRGRDFERTVVYLTDQTHHAIHKALRIAGLTEAIIREVPMDTEFRMQTTDLEYQIEADQKAGLLPWLIVGSAGTTDAGAIDPLIEIGGAAKKHDLWFHVDAAYGGFFLLSETGKARIQGVDLADSIVMDPHKGLFLPYGIGAVLVKEGDRLNKSHYYSANYMQDSVEANEEVSPSEVSPELTKHFRGLRMWLSLQYFGLEPFRAALEEKIQLAQYFYKALQSRPGFELGPEPALSVVLFRFMPNNAEANTFNQRLIQKLQSGGQVFMSSTKVQEHFYLRVAILSFRTHKQEVDEALTALDQAVATLQDELEPEVN